MDAFSSLFAKQTKEFGNRMYLWVYNSDYINGERIIGNSRVRMGVTIRAESKSILKC